MHWSVYDRKSVNTVYRVEARINNGRWLTFHQEPLEAYAAAKIEGYFARFSDEYTLFRSDDVMTLKRTGKYQEEAN